MEGFPSGQREQTVNLSSMTSVVRIHHLPPKEPILIRVSVLFWCQVEWIRKPALRNVPVARFNHRGFRRNGSESTTGRAGTHVAVRPWAAITNHGRHAPNPQERQVSTRPIRRKERSFDSEINLHRLLGTIYCRLRRYPVGAQNHTVRGRTLRLAKSRLRRLLAGRPLRWVCSPYGIYGAKPCLSTNKRSGFIT